MPDCETIEVTIEGGLGRITLDRAACLNALNETALRELVDAARHFDANRQVRVVVVQGRGRGFCAGVDVKALAATLFSSGVPEERALRDLHALGQQMVEAIAGMRAVTVAAVRGCAIGGGILLMAACDFRVVAEDTTLAIPEIDMGLPYTWGGVARLVQELGPSLARDLIMTGRRFGAAEVARAGFVHRVVASDDLEAETSSLAQLLLDKPALALDLVKRQFGAARGELMTDSSADADSFVQAISDPRFLPAVTAYMQSKQRSQGS